MFHQITVENEKKVYKVEKEMYSSSEAEEEMYLSSEAEEEMYSSSEAEEEMYSSSEDELQPAENRFQNIMGAVGRSGNSMGSVMMRGGASLRKSVKKRGGGASKGLMRKWNEKRGKIKETPLNHVEWNVEDKHNLVYKLFKKYHGQVEDFQEKGKSRSKVTGKKAWKMYFAGKDPFVQFEIFKYWIGSHKWKSTVTVLKALRLWTHLQNCLSNSLPRGPIYQQPQQPVYQQPQQPVYQQPQQPVYQQPQQPVYQQPPQAPSLPPAFPPQAPALPPQAPSLPPALPPQAPALPPALPPRQ